MFLALTVAVVTGVVLTFAIGADRTARAPERYTTSRGGGFDGEVQQESGRPRTAEVASLPGVSSVESVTFIFAAVAPPGEDAPDAAVFVGSHLAVGMRLVEGRAPDPAQIGEFVATRSFVDAEGVEPGARFDLLTITEEEAQRGGFEALGAEGRNGPSLEALLVGVIDGPAEIQDPTPVAVLPMSLLDAHDIGTAVTIMSVELRPGDDLASLRTQLDSLPDGETLRLEPAELISSEIRTAVNGQALGLWLLAAVAAAAAVAVLGQLVTRSARLTADERPSLAALGFSKGQLLAESMGRAAVPIVAGSVLGVAIAVAASSSFPTGFVRRIEPHPGVLVDPGVLFLCAGGLLVALLLWITASLIVGRPLRGERPSAVVESVALRAGSATLATGLRFAFTRSHRERGSVRAAITGMLLTTALLVGAVVVGSSLERLVTDDARFGNNFDAIFGSGGDVVPEDLLASLEADPDVAALMLYATGQARVGQETIRLAGMEPVKGDLGPTILSGRPPSADDEIALGRLIAETLGTRVGADLTVEGDVATRTFRVTGLAVIPGIEGMEGVGQDAVVTIGGLRRLSPEAQPNAAGISFREGAPADTAQRYGVGQNSEPGVIVNLARIRAIPFLLALLVGLLAVLTVVHVMVTSVHNRRRDLAVLRSLGADGRWITRAVHWQATAFAMVPLVLGTPIGLIAGRKVFEALADSLGAVPDPSFPYALLASVVVGLVGAGRIWLRPFPPAGPASSPRVRRSTRSSPARRTGLRFVTARAARTALTAAARATVSSATSLNLATRVGGDGRTRRRAVKAPAMANQGRTNAGGRSSGRTRHPRRAPSHRAAGPLRAPARATPRMPRLDRASPGPTLWRVRSPWSLTRSRAGTLVPNTRWPHATSSPTTTTNRAHHRAAKTAAAMLSRRRPTRTATAPHPPAATANALTWIHSKTRSSATTK